jgi:hypothetical protein
MHMANMGLWKNSIAIHRPKIPLINSLLYAVTSLYAWRNFIMLVKQTKRIETTTTAAAFYKDQIAIGNISKCSLILSAVV